MSAASTVSMYHFEKSSLCLVIRLVIELELYEKDVSEAYLLS